MYFMETHNIENTLFLKRKAQILIIGMILQSIYVTDDICIKFIA